MPLQNRVTAFGEIVAHPARGQIMGNRGGRFHNQDRTLSKRRWASKAWIICLLDFKDRHRRVMSPASYTELFFLDEVTALAAGHRPCFECRRKKATSYAEKWASLRGLDRRARAHDMDVQLHEERLKSPDINPHPKVDISSLPDGTMIQSQGKVAAVSSQYLLPWTMDGYENAVRRPSNMLVEVLTPPSTVAILKAGYTPLFHLRINEA